MEMEKLQKKTKIEPFTTFYFIGKLQTFPMRTKKWNISNKNSVTTDAISVTQIECHRTMNKSNVYSMWKYRKWNKRQKSIPSEPWQQKLKNILEQRRQQRWTKNQFDKAKRSEW